MTFFLLLVVDTKYAYFPHFPTFPPLQHLFITVKTAFHHCTFLFITAHFVHHCTLKHDLESAICYSRQLGSVQGIGFFKSAESYPRCFPEIDVFWRKRLQSEPKPN